MSSANVLRTGIKRTSHLPAGTGPVTSNAMAEVMHSMNRKLVAVPLAIGVLVSASCLKTVEPNVCTAVAYAGIYITLQDRFDDSPPPFTGVWARAVQGTYRDSTTEVFTNSETGVQSVALVYERKGTYDVTVHANGYEDFTQDAVFVSADECHVVPVQINARLVKQ